MQEPKHIAIPHHDSKRLHSNSTYLHQHGHNFVRMFTGMLSSHKPSPRFSHNDCLRFTEDFPHHRLVDNPGHIIRLNATKYNARTSIRVTVKIYNAYNVSLYTTIVTSRIQDSTGYIPYQQARQQFQTTHGTMGPFHL